MATKDIMFIDVELYIKLSKKDRTLHQDLDEPCILIGGADSRHYRGLLAHYLKTTIPSGMKIVLCHSCHNHKCSNPRHLYWGTSSENVADSKENGTWTSPAKLTKAKYGDVKYNEMMLNCCRLGGQANKGMVKISEEFFSHLDEVLKSINLNDWGSIKKASLLVSRTPQYLKRLIDKYYVISDNGIATRKS